MMLAPGYTLHDSMTALELMAPKMDRGMHLKNYTSVEARHASGDLVLPPPNASAAISLLDHLFRMEVAWYSGYPVISTVYTCVFAHPYASQVLRDSAKPYLDTLTSPLEAAPTPHKEDSGCLSFVLHALLVLAFKTSSVVHNLVRHADTFEEEDYAPFVGAVKLDPTGMDNPAALHLAQRATKVLHVLYESLDPEVETSSVFSKRSCAILYAMLHFRTLYFSLMVNFQDVSATNALEECSKLIQKAGPGRTASAGSATQLEEKNCYFDPVICHKDMGSMPPRTVALQSAEDAQKMMEKVLKDLLLVRKLGDCKSLEEMYRCLKVFSSRRANIVPRSMVVDYLYSEDCKALFKYSYMDLIQNDMKDMGVPESMYKSEVCMGLIQKGLLRAIYDIMHICTTNRSRKRRRIVHLLRNWRDIQHSLEVVHQQVYLADIQPDGKLPDKSPERLVNTLDIWALKWIIRLMNEFLLLGFELELYAIYEVDFILWYLDYISKSTADNRKRMDQFLQLEYAYETAQAKAAKKKKKKKGSKIKQLKKPKQLDFIEFDRVEEIIYGYLSYGLLCFLLALRRENKHADPDLKFGDNHTRFLHRTAPFDNMRPGRPSYENFLKLSDVTKYDATQIYDNAVDTFQKAKEAASLGLKALQRRPDLPQWHQDYQAETMRALARVALSNTLSVAKLRALPPDNLIPLTLDFSSHRSFPVVVQKESRPTGAAP